MIGLVIWLYFVVIDIVRNLLLFLLVVFSLGVKIKRDIYSFD